MTKTSKKPPLILVDGSSYLYRAFHALPPLTNSKGEATGAVYGVANMLRKLQKEYQPTQMAVVFDAKGKTFRHEQYPDYKANRPPMPDELRSQIEPLHELVELMGLPIIVEPGVEADDVIGTLARQASEKNIPVLISTGDKDLAQLVNDKVTLINTMNDTVMDERGVEEKFGVPPERIIDYLTLIGDKSDNIPGVDKVGPKTAEKWLAQYGTLDDLLAHADEIKGKVGENLRNALDQIPLSRDLVTIRTGLDLKEKLSDLNVKPVQTEKLVAKVKELEFNTWLREMENNAEEVVKKENLPQVDYETILTEKDFQRWLKALGKAELFAFDTETTSLDYMQAEIVGVSFSVEQGKAAYLPLAHDYPGAPAQLDRSATLEKLRPLLENPDQAKLGHNLKYDRSVLLNHGVELKGIKHDTMLESYVLNSTASRHDMDTLCEKHLGHENIHFEDVAGKGAKQLTFNQVGLEQAAPYAAEDADMTLRLHQHFWPQLQKLKGQRELYETIEIPLLPILSRVERNGVLVDADALFQQSHELSERMAEIERDAWKAAGQEFNLGSPKQLQQILFEEQKLPVIRKTPKGQPSTAEDVLQELANDYPLPRLVLEYRSMSKLKSTYTDKLPQMINPQTGRVHTSYHQAVASTGRLSSSDPNLQNIPVRTEEGRRIRQAFIAPDGHQILAVDYSQIELRIMAHLSGDEGLQKAFAEGLDIHSATAAEVFGGRVEEVTADQRRAAKAINFGLIYGMSAFGLGKQLSIGRNEAQEYVDLYFARYPGVKKYMDKTREQAKDQGYVETLFGRRLYLPEIHSRNAQRRQYAERTAINAPMQGTAADIIKLAMIAVDQWIGKQNPSIKMIMQVHDELVFEVKTQKLEAATKAIIKLMESAASLSVPLIVEAGTGSNWDEAH
ncbi:MAG TPA: DNA polymerase I [Chromatiales bacterium]|nr:DNA polymerase I [Thiotrichales bacterium]HIP69642.1 DNA polymerase I [Chromatiales bacterium]